MGLQTGKWDKQKKIVFESNSSPCKRSMTSYCRNNPRMVAKHTHASQVVVTCRHDSHTVSLSVDDNGVGFDLSERTTSEMGLGLVGMRERIESLGGQLEINSVLGEGTLLVASLKMS